MRQTFAFRAFLLPLIATFATSACTSPGQKTAIGAGAGAVAGAGLGAVIGHQTGKRGQGAAIGAAVGGILGGTIGNRLDKQAKELAAIAETKRTDEGIITKLKSDILFDTGRAELKPSATANLTKMAEILKKYPENVLKVKGFTDSTGTKAINTDLSARRASAVRQNLIAGGVPETTISTLGLADADPVAPNTTANGRQANRRVEIEITVDETKVPTNETKI